MGTRRSSQADIACKARQTCGTRAHGGKVLAGLSRTRVLATAARSLSEVAQVSIRVAAGGRTGSAASMTASGEEEK